MALRLLLIEPPFYSLYKKNYGLRKSPLGLGSLAALVMKETDAVVRIIHADLNPSPEPFETTYLAGEGFARAQAALSDSDARVWSGLRRGIEDFAPNVAGISAKTPAWAASLICAGLVKAANPKTLVLAGGPHPSAVGAAVLKHPDIDAAIPGEGEKVLVDCLQTLERGGRLGDVPGVLLRGRPFRSRPPAKDLDQLPFPHPAARAVMLGADLCPPEAFAHVFTARGCPFNCAYCASRTVWGRRVRMRGIDNVLAEIDSLRLLGATHIHFDDDTFGVTRPRLLALCQALEGAFSAMTFSCETHVNLVTGQTARALGRAGFTTIQLGLESGDEAMLARIGKGFGLKRALAACERITGEGMRLEAFFMAGFPDETKDSLAATRRLMDLCRADKIIYSIFTPYPGTPLYARCLEMGLIGPGYDYSRHNHQSPANCFCPNLGARFRELAAPIETFVAAHNAASRRGAPGP